MKKIFLIFILILFGVKSYILSQVLVNKTSDIDSLIQNKSQYINHPFSFLLNHINIEIKKVRAFPKGTTNFYTIGVFHLFFVDNKAYDSLKKISNKIPPNIIVYVKEDFVWKPKLNNWNNSDAEKYGNLTVIDIGKFQSN